MLREQNHENKLLRIITGGIFLCLLIGVVLYALFGHQLIEAMYEGRARGVLNSLIERQATFSVVHYYERADSSFLKYLLLPIFCICFLLSVKRSSNRIFDIMVCVLLMAFSFYFSFKSGERGFFAFDQSIIFDGSYRVFSGQIPYKDFIIPVGPMVFWIQAIFFKFFGISYFSYIVGAAFINLLATICSILVIRMVFPAYRLLSYLAGLLTAVWFYAPFGTPWIEQTAFFFSFVAIIALLFSLFIKDRYPISNRLLLLISGGLAFLSVLSKQNVGVFIFPLYLLLIITIYMPELKKIFYSVVVFFVGFLGSLTAFLLWLLFYSRASIFIQYVVKVPAAMGKIRLFRRGMLSLIKGLLFGQGQMNWRLINLAFVLIAIFALFLCALNLRDNKDICKQVLLSCTLCIYFVLFQNVFTYVTRNQLTNGFIFTGVIFSIGIGLFLSLCKLIQSKSFQKSIITFGVFLSIVVCSFGFVRGINVSWSREVHDIFGKSKFTKYFDEDQLENLKWGEPTPIEGANVKQKDIVDIYDYLKLKNKNFFIFPDFTIFYSLLDVPSPQPVLWFHRGLTYPRRYDPGLDKWIVRDLDKNRVEIIILEEKSFFRTQPRLKNFPMLKSYIENNFQKVDQIGIFNIYEKVT